MRAMGVKLLFLTYFLALASSKLTEVGNFVFWFTSDVFIQQSVNVSAVILPTTPLRFHKDPRKIYLYSMVYRYALTPETCKINSTVSVILFKASGYYLEILKDNATSLACTGDSSSKCLGLVNVAAQSDGTYRLLPDQFVQSDYPLTGGMSPENCYNETENATTIISFRGYMPRANSTFTLFNSDSLLTATKLAKVSFVWTPSTTTTISPNTSTEPPVTSSTTPTAISSTPKPEVSTTTSTTTSSPTPVTTSVKPPTTENQTLLTTETTTTTTTGVSISIEAAMNTTVEVTDSTATTPDETTYTVVGERVGTDGTTPDALVQIQLTTHNGQQPLTVERVDESPASSTSNITKSTVKPPTYSDSLNVTLKETTSTVRPNKYRRRRAGPSDMVVDSPENSGLVNSFASSPGELTISAPEAAQTSDANTTSYHPEDNATSARNATWTAMPDTGIRKNISSAATPASTATLGITASNSTY
ncbi:hypothetical protein SprV_0902773700 [Sparganum proliferum]